MATSIEDKALERQFRTAIRKRGGELVKSRARSTNDPETDQAQALGFHLVAFHRSQCWDRL